MRRYTMRALLGATLAVGLLAGSVSATPLTTAPSVTAAGPQTDAYTVDLRDHSLLPVWGKVTELGEGRVLLQNDDKGAPYQRIFLNLNEDTLILDAVTGADKTLADLREGETVYAYVGRAVTRSNPPMASAQLVLCGIPADYAVPTYAEVEKVTVAESGAVSLLTDRDVVLHLGEDTDLSAYGADTADMAVAPAGIRPGTKVLAWYSAVALSLPAQAAPTKVLVFPYGYESYLTATESGAVLDGDMVLSSVVEDGKCYVSLRALAESLGYTVTWDNEKRAVVVRKGENSYTVAVGDSSAQVGGEEHFLTRGPILRDGVTYLTVEDAAVLHHLKLVRDGVPGGMCEGLPVAPKN